MNKNWHSRRKKPWQVAPSQTPDPQVFLQPEQLQDVNPNALLCSDLHKKPFYSERYCALPILVCTALTILIFMAIINIILNIMLIINIIFNNFNRHLLLVHRLPSHPCPKLGPGSEQVLQSLHSGVSNYVKR